MRAGDLAKLLLKNPDAEVEIEVYGDLVFPISTEDTFYNHPDNKVVIVKTSVSKETPELVEAKAEARKYEDKVNRIYNIIRE